MYQDKAGNRIVRNFDGSVSVENAEGKRVNKKDSEKFLKKYGFKTTTKNKKLQIKPKKDKYSIW